MGPEAGGQPRFSFFAPIRAALGGANLLLGLLCLGPVRSRRAAWILGVSRRTVRRWRATLLAHGAPLEVGGGKLAPGHGWASWLTAHAVTGRFLPVTPALLELPLTPRRTLAAAAFLAEEHARRGAPRRWIRRDRERAAHAAVSRHTILRAAGDLVRLGVAQAAYQELQRANGWPFRLRRLVLAGLAGKNSTDPAHRTDCDPRHPSPSPSSEPPDRSTEIRDMVGHLAASKAAAARAPPAATVRDHASSEQLDDLSREVPVRAFWSLLERLGVYPPPFTAQRRALAQELAGRGVSPAAFLAEVRRALPRARDPGAVAAAIATRFCRESVRATWPAWLTAKPDSS